MRPPTPRSTLFPYTTLFRSECRNSNADGAWPPHVHHGFLDVQHVAAQRPSFLRRSHDAMAEHLGCASADRKSTRLNSSHEWISYAVFCLKKKKELRVNMSTC